MRNENLSQFFGLSRAAWLVLPRVTMEHMPDKWQKKMAKLLEEHSEMFPNQSDLSFHISAKADGKFVKLPEHLCNYRHPDREAIDAMKGGYELRSDCKLSGFDVPNHKTGDLVGVYNSEDDAMRAAEKCNLLRPGDEDEGGQECGVLVDNASIKQVLVT